MDGVKKAAANMADKYFATTKKGACFLNGKRCFYSGLGRRCTHTRADELSDLAQQVAPNKVLLV